MAKQRPFARNRNYLYSGLEEKDGKNEMMIIWETLNYAAIPLAIDNAEG